jgi:hypothetical protein
MTAAWLIAQMQLEAARARTRPLTSWLTGR